MKRILLSEDALEDLNEGFLFYEAQDHGLGDYFTACLRSDLEGLRLTAGVHRVGGATAPGDGRGTAAAGLTLRGDRNE